MDTHEATEVRGAIEDSIRETRIVTLKARLDSDRWVRLGEALRAATDDSVRTRRMSGDAVLDAYWGTDDGDEWRVHLVGM